MLAIEESTAFNSAALCWRPRSILVDVGGFCYTALRRGCPAQSVARLGNQAWLSLGREKTEIEDESVEKFVNLCGRVELAHPWWPGRTGRASSWSSLPQANARLVELAQPWRPGRSASSGARPPAAMARADGEDGVVDQRQSCHDGAACRTRWARGRSEEDEERLAA
ncbi:hypothetical protein EJB05_09737 [Eragrostis curvula]|uniref:Uncharacterized protein n=1 Tax=Eragrostis curvula TaxID=38414 RepID=A0A5J9W3G1_9POAL|nr:hypothetical protein EJB05_09737 [Eragrostis curvula]